MRRNDLRTVMALTVAVIVFTSQRVPARQNAPATLLDHAQYEFFSGRYDQAISESAALRDSAEGLQAYELLTSALHFKIKNLLGSAPDKGKAFKQCTLCPGLLERFMAEVTAGRAVAKSVLKGAPQDQKGLYYLAKLDLNEVWLNNSTLGRRTGFGKYKDARRMIDTVLTINPKHIRARVAHAWIDYAVDTRVPFGFRWMFGGGDTKRGLQNMREAAQASTVRFETAEAWFGLWEMLVLEKRFDEALDAAKRLARDFPENQELQRFIANPKR